MKHTKGKWRAVKNNLTTLPRTVIYVPQCDQPIFEIEHNEEKMTESVANAKLIAAAPELLEALKETYINLIDVVKEANLSELKAKRANANVQKAIRAIKKATE